MHLTNQLEFDIQNRIFDLPSGVYGVSDIYDGVSKFINKVIDKQSLRWVISYLIKNKSNKIKRISRGYYAINKKNVLLNKYSIDYLIQNNDAFYCYQTACYKLRVIEGINTGETIIISDTHKNKIILKNTDQHIIFKKFKYPNNIGLEIFINYFRHINKNSFNELKVIFDCIKRFNLKINDVKHIVPKSKIRLLYNVFNQSNGYGNK